MVSDKDYIMVACSVSNCKNSTAKISKNKDGITFHRFPRDKERRELWTQAINREDSWTATNSSAVCSEHFDVNNFYLTEGGLRRLSLNAIPTLNISVCQEAAPTIAVLPIIDIKPTDTEEVIQLKHTVRRLEVIAENRKKKINLMWQAKRRLKKKLKQMRSMVTHLVKMKNTNMLAVDERDIEKISCAR